MAINLKQLKDRQKELEAETTTDGGKLFFYSKNTGEETNIRHQICKKDEAVLNGNYFLEQVLWWVNGKPYLSNSSPYIGMTDVIQEEIDAALASGDEDAIAIVNKTKTIDANGKSFTVKEIKKERRFLMSILLLDVKYNDDDELEYIKVVDEAGKIFVCDKISQFLEINSIWGDRQYNNQTDDALADREKGWNVILSKVKVKGQTTYKAKGWNVSTEMDEKYYKDIPSVVEMSQAMERSQKNLRSIIRNAIWGDEIVDEPVKEDKKNKKSSFTGMEETQEEKPKKIKRQKINHDEDEEKETKQKKSNKSSNSGASLLEDVENGIDEDDLADLD